MLKDPTITPFPAVAPGAEPVTYPKTGGAPFVGAVAVEKMRFYIFHVILTYIFYVNTSLLTDQIEDGHMSLILAFMKNEVPVAPAAMALLKTRLPPLSY